MRTDSLGPEIKVELTKVDF